MPSDTHRTRRDQGKDAIVVRIDPLLADLIPGFLQNRRQDLLTMRAALDDGDFKTVGRLGHGMHGSGGGYGFQAISDIGMALEMAAKNSDTAASQEWLDELSRYLDRVEVI